MEFGILYLIFLVYGIFNGWEYFMISALFAIASNISDIKGDK